MPAGNVTLTVAGRAGTVRDRDTMRVWVAGGRRPITVHKRQWPGVWPPEVGDAFTVTITDPEPPPAPPPELPE